MPEYAVLEVIENLAADDAPPNWRHSTMITAQDQAEGAFVDWHYGDHDRQAKIVAQHLTLDAALVTAGAALRRWHE